MAFRKKALAIVMSMAMVATSAVNSNNDSQNGGSRRHNI